MVKRFFPDNYIIQILITLVMYGLIGYFAWVGTKQYFVVPILLGLSFYILNKRIYLYNDRVVIIQGFKKTEIDFAKVIAFSIGDFTPKFSSTQFLQYMQNIQRLNIRCFIINSIQNIQFQRLSKLR
jgi:hypothetical protein